MVDVIMRIITRYYIRLRYTSNDVYNYISMCGNATDLIEEARGYSTYSNAKRAAHRLSVAKSYESHPGLYWEIVEITEKVLDRSNESALEKLAKVSK